MGTLILKQFIGTRKSLTHVLTNISDKAITTVPEGFNNNIHWQVGHILVTAELFLFNGQQNLPEHFNEAFGPGTKPADWGAAVPSFGAVLQAIEEQTTRIAAIDVTSFDTPLKKRFIGNETIGELAAMGAFHEAMHLGQIQMLKRLIDITIV